MSFKANERTVDRLLNDAIYYIPRNQRRYVWTLQNWNDIYEDVLLIVDKIAESHFLGSIVLKKEPKEDGLDKYTIIDGQQRILTLTIFLSAIMFAFKHRNMMEDFGGTQKYLVAQDHKGKSREIVYPEYHLSLPKLVTTLIDRPQEEISKYSITAFSNICMMSPNRDKPILEAFKFFSERIEALTDKQVLELRDAIINIGYVEIISSDEDSYTIFEILNARGLDLEDHELLKNYIMRYLQPVERRDDVKKIWEDMELALGSNFKSFFRHYAVQKYDYDSRSGTTVYKAIQNATHGRGVGQLLDDIARKANYYKKIVEPTEENTVEYEIFSFFKSKRFVIFRPLLLSLMHRRALDQITAEKYNDILHFLYNFFVCYKIIGQENSNILSNSVNKYAFRLETDFSDKVLDECLNSIKSRLPTLELFTNSFKNVCWSHCWPLFNDSKYKERCQLVLIMLEQYSSNRLVNIPVTIEHILPDAICIENSQIGNLLPLEESLNGRCNGKSFEEKLDIYLESTLLLPRLFAKRYKSQQFEPQRRTEFLAKFVYNNVLGVAENLVEKVT